MLLQTLANNWAITPVKTFQQGNYAPDARGWHAIDVPAHWQQHPALEHHSGKVVYRCHFAAPAPPSPPPAPRYWLRCNGLFYYAQAYLNGGDLGQHEGYFIPYERDISHLLQPENTLVLEVDCPDEHRKTSKYMITGVFSHWDCLDPHANPGGIWLPVELHQSGAVRIQSVRCYTETFNDHFAQLRYSATLDAAAPMPALLRWTITPHTDAATPQVIAQQRTLQAGPQEVGGLLKLHNPLLWWTHDLGHPDLYTITLEVECGGALSDQTSFDYGVRRFELRDWIPHLNGVRFFMKGSNYPPGDMRIATMTRERYDRDMQMVREGNMNVLRVHAHVEHPQFYAAANAAGLLLWQDMPLQWLYHARILPEARRQARAMVRLLANHPSVAVWCMHNEPIFFGDTSDKRLTTRVRSLQSNFGFSWNRDVLDSQLKRVAEQEDPHRPVVRSSGEYHIPGARGGTDTHYYFGWYTAHGSLPQFDKLRTMTPANIRFVSEFGAQSFPNAESSARFLPADPAAIDTAHLAARHSFQPQVMSTWVPWPDATSLEELAEMTQTYQSEINRFYIDRLRYHKYKPTGGCVAFLFCDAYPAITWSVVDYWRVPKRSYAALRMAYSPQYAFTLIPPRSYQVAERIDIPLYVVNDAHEPVRGAHLKAHLYAPDGSELVSVSHILTLEADSMAWETDRLRLTPDQPGQYTLTIVLAGVSQEVRHRYTIDVVR